MSKGSLQLGLIVGVGYAAFSTFNNVITPNIPKPVLFDAATGSYHIVGILIVTSILLGLK